MSGHASRRAGEIISRSLDEIKNIELRHAKKSAKRGLNLAKSLGIPNKVLFHNWNIFMIILAIWLFVLYYTKIFGYYNVRRGILTTPGIIYPEIPCSLLYMYSFCAGTEFYAVLMWLYKVHMMNMFIAITCMLIDTGLFIFARDVFCKM